MRLVSLSVVPSVRWMYNLIYLNIYYIMATGYSWQAVLLLQLYVCPAVRSQRPCLFLTGLPCTSGRPWQALANSVPVKQCSSEYRWAPLMSPCAISIWQSTNRCCPHVGSTRKKREKCFPAEASLQSAVVPLCLPHLHLSIVFLIVLIIDSPASN